MLCRLISNNKNISIFFFFCFATCQRATKTTEQPDSPSTVIKISNKLNLNSLKKIYINKLVQLVLLQIKLSNNK